MGTLKQINSLHITFLLLLCLGLMGPILVKAEEIHPLRPVDTSSPRSTLSSFLKILNAAHVETSELKTSYIVSDRLYFSESEKEQLDRIKKQVRVAARALDLSSSLLGIIATNELANRRVLQLKSVLDRIKLPSADSIPDAEMMESLTFKRWTIPDTEITIQLIKEGPRAGEYLFTEEVVKRLPEFHESMKGIQYLTGGSPGWYESYRNSTLGLAVIIPYRWTLKMPSWAEQIVFDQPIWRWIGLIIVFYVFVVLCSTVQKIIYFLSRRSSLSKYYSNWKKLSWLLALLAILPLATYFLINHLRISGEFRHVLSVFSGVGFYLLLAWIVWASTDLLSNYITRARSLSSGGIDSQFIRLSIYLVSIIFIVIILIFGAQQLGFPAYSILAGLGIGGLAIALAAQENVANILGSLVIMIEKPFRVGHIVRIGNVEGKVESIGFRSVHIRTFYDSVMSIPSREIISSSVDNMELCQYRRTKLIIRVEYGTPTEKIKKFIEGIKKIILENEHTRKDFFQVALNEFDERNLNIVIYLFLEVPDWPTELVQREEIFLEILQLAEIEGIKIGSPMGILDIKSVPKNTNAKLPGD